MGINNFIYTYKNWCLYSWNTFDTDLHTGISATQIGIVSITICNSLRYPDIFPLRSYMPSLNEWIAFRQCPRGRHVTTALPPVTFHLFPNMSQHRAPSIAHNIISAKYDRLFLYCVHYSDVIISAMPSQITTTVCSSLSSGAHQRKHRSSELLAFS